MFLMKMIMLIVMIMETMIDLIVMYQESVRNDNFPDWIVNCFSVEIVDTLLMIQLKQLIS